MLPVKLGINLGLDQFSGNSLTVDHHALVKLMTARADDYDFKTQRNKNDGFSVLRRIRRESQVPIIMLTARSYIGDKVAGLTGGADDYITKPFEIEELLARIEVALRHGQSAKPSATSSTYQIGDLMIDDDTKRVQRGTRLLSLTPREYALLLALAKNRDQACSRDDLLNQVWGVDFIGQPNIVDVYIRQLRHKIDGNPKLPRLIHTIRGTGYMLSASLDAG